MTREEAIEQIEQILSSDVSFKFFSEDKTALNMAIESLQTIDNCDQCEWCCPSDGTPTIHVVRCKDCRWYDNRYGEVCHNPRYGDGHANYSPPYVDEEYWCKDGKRREE